MLNKEEKAVIDKLFDNINSAMFAADFETLIDDTYEDSERLRSAINIGKELKEIFDIAKINHVDLGCLAQQILEL